jgi:hypothetical protein
MSDDIHKQKYLERKSKKMNVDDAINRLNTEIGEDVPSSPIGKPFNFRLWGIVLGVPIAVLLILYFMKPRFVCVVDPTTSVKSICVSKLLKWSAILATIILISMVSYLIYSKKSVSQFFGLKKEN